MIHTLSHKGLQSESYTASTEPQRRVLAQQLWRERKRGFIVSPIVKHQSFAVVEKVNLQAIRRIDVDGRLCFGAGFRQNVPAPVPASQSVSLPYNEQPKPKQYSIS